MAAAVVLLAICTGVFAIQRDRVIADLARWTPARVADNAAHAWLRHRARGDLARLARRGEGR